MIAVATQHVVALVVAPVAATPSWSAQDEADFAAEMSRRHAEAVKACIEANDRTNDDQHGATS